MLRLLPKFELTALISPDSPISRKSLDPHEVIAPDVNHEAVRDGAA
jgi:hypothetical protein